MGRVIAFFALLPNNFDVATVASSLVQLLAFTLAFTPFGFSVTDSNPFYSSHLKPTDMNTLSSTNSNDTQRDDTQRDDTQRDDTQRDDTQRDDTQRDDVLSPETPKAAPIVDGSTLTNSPTKSSTKNSEKPKHPLLLTEWPPFAELRSALRCSDPYCCCRFEDMPVHCPAHATIFPNLEFKQSIKRGKLQIKCLDGCKKSEVIAAMRRVVTARDQIAQTDSQTTSTHPEGSTSGASTWNASTPKAQQ